MLTYHNNCDTNHDVKSVTVKLDGRVVGTIKREPLGWRYQTKDGKSHGERFDSIREVMRSLEQK